ncbi:sugar-binding transcriptional regulator [Krasilnikovia sp. MM14-A1004]|uniref:sugar-binding transcriptional regulator n=1 Tax=Krasilnikovia sp. MM14-A1004 TaxID=3373541 RepID=UPI00399C624B
MAETRQAQAVTAARMYYGAGQSTQEIADYLRVSRSTVSRLLAFAREAGVVEVRVHETLDASTGLAADLVSRYPQVRFQVIGVQPGASSGRVNNAVARYAAHAIAAMVEPGMTIGIAWGNTVSSFIDYLNPKPVNDLRVVQLNGAGNGANFGLAYASDIVVRFAENFAASPHLFPVPAFFDHAETKEALWKERSIRQILALQEHADLLVFSTGALVGDPASHIYTAGFLSDRDVRDLRAAGVVGDIGTVFYDERGSGDLPINRRSSGPPLALYARSRRSVCVASGAGKVPGLAAALSAGYLSDLIVDSRTAAELVRRAGPDPGRIRSVRRASRGT